MKTVHIVLSLLRTDSPCHWPASTLSTRRFPFPLTTAVAYNAFSIVARGQLRSISPGLWSVFEPETPVSRGNNAAIASQVRKYPSPSSEPGQITKIKLRGCTLIGIVVGLGKGNCFQMDEKGEKTHNSAPCGLDRTRFKAVLGGGSLRPGPPACF